MCSLLRWMTRPHETPSAKREERVSEARVSLRYVGPEVESGEMDVYALAPALIELGDLCGLVGSHLLGPDVRVGLRVNTNFRKGSFVVDLTVVEVLGFAAAYLATEGTAAMRILDAIFGGHSLRTSLLGMLKKLQGQPVEKRETLPDGSVEVQVNIQGSDNKITIVVPRRDAHVVDLYAEDAVREKMISTVRPVGERVGLERVEAHRENEKVIDVSHDEAAAALTAPSESAGESVQETTYTGILEIIKPVLEGRSQWDVREGGTRYRVAVLDAEFLEAVDRGHVVFRHPTALRAEIHVSYRRKPSGAMIAERTITKVLGFIDPPGPQPQLPLG